MRLGSGAQFLQPEPAVPSKREASRDSSNERRADFFFYFDSETSSMVSTPSPSSSLLPFVFSVHGLSTSLGSDGHLSSRHTATLVSRVRGLTPLASADALHLVYSAGLYYHQVSDKTWLMWFGTLLCGTSGGELFLYVQPDTTLFLFAPKKPTVVEQAHKADASCFLYCHRYFLGRGASHCPGILDARDSRATHGNLDHSEQHRNACRRSCQSLFPSFSVCISTNNFCLFTCRSTSVSTPRPPSRAH